MSRITLDQEQVTIECGDCACIKTVPWSVTGGPIKVCSRYWSPRAWHRKGGCPFNLAWSSDKAQKGKVRAGQQKSKGFRF